MEGLERGTPHQEWDSSPIAISTEMERVRGRSRLTLLLLLLVVVALALFIRSAAGCWSSTSPPGRT